MIMSRFSNGFPGSDPRLAKNSLLEACHRASPAVTLRLAQWRRRPGGEPPAAMSPLRGVPGQDTGAVVLHFMAGDVTAADYFCKRQYAYGAGTSPTDKTAHHRAQTMLPPSFHHLIKGLAPFFWFMLILTTAPPHPPSLFCVISQLYRSENPKAFCYVTGVRPGHR